MDYFSGIKENATAAVSEKLTYFREILTDHG